ncbi:hypothetical protein J4E93_002254 [Alternaria ventricosa]|uniref:uncharacterized protein n=1 Tax=Alternaria ventricosa TaxID=1187951 RepID=UPI0020C389F4|nr:uncharacterized protein J4E93_002254 [Alternaria ventricosa]KAI4652057.1 hypothetical protein J4E93_002254 [Alternaria ventricosa]
MPGMWKKTKLDGAEQIAAATADKERATQKAEAQFLARQAPSSHALVTVARNGNGDMVKYIVNGMAWTDESVPAEKQVLAFGHAWLPAYPKGDAGPYNHWSEYGQNQSEFILVMDVDIGFNEVNIGLMEGMRFLQLREVRVSENPFGKFFEGVASSSLDPAREFFTMALDGSIQAHPASAPAPQEQPGNPAGDFVGLSGDQFAETPWYEDDMEVESSCLSSSGPSFGPDFFSGSDMSAPSSEPPTNSPSAGDMAPGWYEPPPTAAFDADMAANGLGSMPFDPYAGFEPAKQCVPA